MKQQKHSTKAATARMKSDGLMSASKQPVSKVEDEDTIKDELLDILETGKERFEKSMESWQRIRMEALDDLKFYKGDQWSLDTQRTGVNRKEPTLTVNRLPQFVKQVENELRRQSISINVYPTDEIGSEDTAGIFAGLIRDIERKSYAQSAYIHAAGESGAMVPGFGFLKLSTCYANSKGFDQEIRIESPQDPFKIVPDGDATQPDSSDASCWFEFEDYSVDAYKRLFPGSELASLDLKVVGAKLSQWVSDGIRVVKYWYKEEMEVIEYLLEDGTTINNIGWYNPNDLDSDEDEEKRAPWPKDEATGKPKVAMRSRNVLDSKVKWVIFNGVEVLDHGEWADSEFPFVSIYGPTLIVNGEKDIRGVIRHAKDSQKMLNYFASSAVRRIGSANKAPWIVDVKSIKGYEAQWKTANTENWSMLPYNSVDPDQPQRQLAAPIRADQTGQINDLLMAAQKFENDLKSTVGIYDAGLGATANEQSGVALKTLAQQGQNANYHYSDALSQAIQRLGYLLIRLIPKVYDTPRAVRIIGADSQEKIVKINQVFLEGNEQKIYDLTSGDYGIAVSAGPAYATRKAQALEQITKLVGADPAILPVIQDILVGEMDFDKAPVIQERLRKLLAMKLPQLVEDEEKGGIASLPPQAQAAISQQQQMIAALSQELQVTHDALQELQVKVATKSIEHQQSMELVKMKTEAEILLERVRMERDKQQLQTKLDADLLEKRMDHQHDMSKVVIEAAKEGHLEDVVSKSVLVNTPPPPRF